MNKIIAITLAITTLLSCQNQPKPAAHGQVNFANKKDYVCGMEVQADWTDTCTFKGHAYAFCAVSCKEAFLANPEKYLAAAK